MKGHSGSGNSGTASQARQNSTGGRLQTGVRSAKDRQGAGKTLLRLLAFFALAFHCIVFGAAAAVAGGWSFDPDTLIWTYHNSETVTNRVEDLKKGWFHDPFDGYWYYFDPVTGHMVYGWQIIDGVDYQFTDIRDRDNYFLQDDGFWHYQANGLIPFGALVEQSGDGDDDPGQPSEPEPPVKPEMKEKPEETLPTREPETEALPEETESAAQPPEETGAPTEPERPTVPEEPDHPEHSTESEEPATLPEPEQPASPADPAETETSAEQETGEEPEVPTEPETLPESEQPTSPEHPTAPSEAEEQPQEPAPPCIVTDSWEEILSHPTIYETCLEEQCEKELLIKGYRVVQEETFSAPVATASDVQPARVSVIGIETDGKGTATFALSELVSDFTMPMNAAPFHCHLRDEVFGSFSTGGWRKSLVNAALNGGVYSFAPEAGQTVKSAHFPGFKLYYESERGKRREIKPHAVEKVSGAGWLFEQLYADRAGYGKPEQEYPRSKEKYGLWLLSEEELHGGSMYGTGGEGAHYPQAKEMAETYWLRTAAAASGSTEEGRFVTSTGTELADTELPVRFAFVLR